MHTFVFLSSCLFYLFVSVLLVFLSLYLPVNLFFLSSFMYSCLPVSLLFLFLFSSCFSSLPVPLSSCLSLSSCLCLSLSLSARLMSTTLCVLLPWSLVKSGQNCQPGKFSHPATIFPTPKVGEEEDRGDFQPTDHIVHSLKCTFSYCACANVVHDSPFRLTE